MRLNTTGLSNSHIANPIASPITKEYCSSGNLKLDAHIINARRVGCWTWYNEDCTLWAEWDYMDGKALQ